MILKRIGSALKEVMQNRFRVLVFGSASKEALLYRLRVLIFGSASREALLNRLHVLGLSSAFKQRTIKGASCFLFSSFTESTSEMCAVY